jgi:hypothetical protein
LNKINQLITLSVTYLAVPTIHKNFKDKTICRISINLSRNAKDKEASWKYASLFLR